jgi:hypothetical protein
MNEAHDLASPETSQTPAAETIEAPVKIKAMRRQPCPCGSGKKFKNCHEGDAGYEVATEGTADVVNAVPGAVDPRGTRGGVTAKPHFPGKQAKTIASQKDFHSYHFRRV